jgi:hypothetical protein
MFMSKDAAQPPDPSVWQAQNLGLIAFPVEPQLGVKQDWWRDLTGKEWEGRQDKRREVEEVGEFEGVALKLAIDASKVQWGVFPRISPDAPPTDLPTIGQFVDRTGWFATLMRKWLERAPAIHRLAFSGALVQPVDNSGVGNDALNRYLRSVDIDPRSTDFVYRINRRVRSRVVPDLEINRLMTWSVTRLVIVDTEIAVGGGPLGGTQVTKHETDACVLHLDINTVPAPADRTLPGPALPDIFNELVGLGADIAARGDA